MKAGVTSTLSENVISRIPVSSFKVTDTTSGATLSVMAMILSDVESIGLPEVSVTAEPDMSSRGDAMVATERPWSSVSSMESTAESVSVISAAPVSETDCPKSPTVILERSIKCEGVTSTVSENTVSRMPVPSSKVAEVSTGPNVRSTPIIGTLLLE